jgi:hypothetical protein
VDLVFLPGDCGGADHIKHYYVVGDLKSGWHLYDRTQVVDR